MKTYEQKFGRLPNGLVDLEEPPETWQFENPLVSVSKDGEVANRLSQLLARPKVDPPKMRPISEILGKEDDGMDFIKKGASTHYERLRRAKEMGLVAMRGAGNQAKEPKPEAADIVKLRKDPAPA